jgi:hypothetical protein
MSAPSERTKEIRKRVAAKWSELAAVTRDFSDQWSSSNSLGHLAMAQFALEVEKQARRAQSELDSGREHRCCDRRTMHSNRLHVLRCAEKSAPSGSIEKARIPVAGLWDGLKRIARLACVLWPWHNSQGHIAVAQFELEVEQARRASAEKDGRA